MCLQVTASPSAGFTTVGVSSVLLTTGKWYYEVLLNSGGLCQIGWGDGSFVGNAMKGEGVGDDMHSWAFDGKRRFIWHQFETVWGQNWRAGANPSVNR